MGVGHSKESHKETRRKQKMNAEDYHHKDEKINQLNKFCSYIKGKYGDNEILEVFAGQGNLTEYYKNISINVTAMTKETFGDSFHAIYKLRADRKKYDVIDIDSYGYPDKFFPVIFEMMKERCLLVFTFPIVGVNCLNGITEQHFYTFYFQKPTIGTVVGRITDWALREWFLVSLLDVVKIKRIYRFVFDCRRVLATEMCNVRNR